MTATDYQRWEDHAFLAEFSDLLRVPSPPGHESRMTRHVADKLCNMGYDPVVDPMGNVLVRLEGQQPDAPTAMLAAHIDEIGLVVIGIEPDGRLKVSNSGGIRPDKLGEGPVELLGDREDARVVGIVSMGSGHVPKGPRPALMWEDVRVVTGLLPEQLAEAGIRVGSTAVPIASRRGPVLLGDPSDPLVGAWTFDDRAGVVTLLRLLERVKREKIRPAWPTVVAFTVHEEGGCHGAKIIAHREQPEVFIAIDGTPIPPEASIVADGRPCAWSKDVAGHYDQRLVRQLIQTGRQAGIDVQTVVLENAYSDASQVLNTGGAYRVAIFGHVRDNSHGYEIAPLRGFDHVLDVLSLLIQQPYS